MLARTADAAIFVQGGLAYPNGFAFTLAIRLRTLDERTPHGPVHRWHMSRALADDVLRFADGSKATIFDGPGPPPPVLAQRGGGGGGRTWDNGFWVWPLPPPGAFAFVCEWPAYGIELTEVEIDTAVIHDAAPRAETLWPDDDGPSGSGGSIFVREVR